MSAAVQVPPAVQEGAEFVFVTLAGGEMMAVLVTCVWAWTEKTHKRNSNENAKSPTKRRAQPKGRNKSIKGPETLEWNKKTFSNLHEI